MFDKENTYLEVTELPIFPLPRVLLLPRSQLPLNIFEKRYLNMVDDALKGNRLIGMIQPRFDGEEDVNSDPRAVFQTGCAGRITSFEGTEDGRYLITLTGISRFDVVKEHPCDRGYRKILPDWSRFGQDHVEEGGVDIGRQDIIAHLRSYLDQNDMICDKWSDMQTIPEERLVACLSMICPFDANEKQALLEAPNLLERARILCTLLEICVREGDSQRTAH